MVKAIVWGGMLLMLFGGMFFGMQAMNKDTGQLVGLAVGKPDDAGVAQLQVVVSLGQTAMDGPTRFTNGGAPDWDHWLDQHFKLTDAAGNRIDLKKGGFQSQDINDMQAGTAEFIALADLAAGKPHTLEVTPIVGQPQVYLRQLDGQPQPFRRVNFEPAY